MRERICGENRILGTKDKIIGRSSVGKADVNLMPTMGRARAL